MSDPEEMDGRRTNGTAPPGGLSDRPSRNGEVDALKFLFAVAVVLFHAHKLQPVPASFFSRGHLAVEFFFLLSGYFMGRRMAAADAPGTARFLVRKISPIFPAFFVSTLIAFVLRTATLPRAKAADWVRGIFLALPEFGLLQMSGLKTGRIYNGPTWYISAMVLAMAVLYPFFRRIRGSSASTAPLLVSVACYAAICQKFGSLGGVATQWTGFCTYGVVRAAAGISLGVFLEDCVRRASASVVPTKAGRVCARLAETVLLVLVLLAMAEAVRWKLPACFDFVVVGLLFAFLFLVLSGFGGTVRCRVFGWCGPASLYLYLNHRGAIWAIVQGMPQATMRQAVLLYVAGTLLSIALCVLGVRILRRFVRFAGRVLFVRNGKTSIAPPACIW